MSFSVIFSDAAVDDIQHAGSYYADISGNLEIAFNEELSIVVALIKLYPQAASFSHADVRYKVMSHFPFVVFYRAKAETIQILRIFNTHQSPETLDDL